MKTKMIAILILLSGCASSQPSRTATITPAPPTEPVSPAVKNSPVVATLSESAPATAAKLPEQPKAEQIVKPDLTCTLAPDIRTLRIENDQPQGCSLYYSKLGKEERIAWSTRARQHCETVRDQVRTNLENASFTCK